MGVLGGGMGGNGWWQGVRRGVGGAGFFPWVFWKHRAAYSNPEFNFSKKY